MKGTDTPAPRYRVPPIQAVEQTVSEPWSESNLLILVPPSFSNWLPSCLRRVDQSHSTLGFKMKKETKGD